MTRNWQMAPPGNPDGMPGSASGSVDGLHLRSLWIRLMMEDAAAAAIATSGLGRVLWPSAELTEDRLPPD